MKMAAFWDAAQYNLVEVDRRFRGAAASIIRQKKETAGYILLRESTR
jgi:hypothetical protein